MGDDKYWAEYNNLQFTKHALIRDYLGGWYAKLGAWAGRVLYLDTHSGRGRHVSGQAGSPLVALDTLLTHSHRERLLSKSEFRFHFIERDAFNVAELRKELAARSVPSNAFIDVSAANCFDVLNRLIATLKASSKHIAPAFVFVDPYGFKVPGKTLQQLMSLGRVELFVNVIWRELDMAIAHGRNGQEGMIRTLNEIFGDLDWRSAIDAPDFDERAEQTISLLARLMGVKWATPVRMLGKNGKTRYILVHFTNHDAGRELMKDVMWKICELSDELGFCARRGTQQLLIREQPDLTPIRDWVLEQLPCRWSTLHERTLAETWRPVHVNDAVRQLYKEKVVGAAPGSAGKFTIKSNPTIAALLRSA